LLIKKILEKLIESIDVGFHGIREDDKYFKVVFLE
jgi:hypothetical protein